MELLGTSFSRSFLRMYFSVWNMRQAHVPHNNIHYLRGEAARAPGERGRKL